MGLRANLNTTTVSATTTTKPTTATRAKLKPTGKMIINGTIVNREQQLQSSSPTTQNTNQAQQKTNNLFKKNYHSKKTYMLPQTVTKKCSSKKELNNNNNKNSENAVNINKQNATEKSKQENELGKLLKYKAIESEDHVDDDVDDIEDDDDGDDDDDDDDDVDDADEEKEEETTCLTTTMMTTTTFRSSSASALLANSMRPQSLNVQQLRLNPANQTQSFFGEVLNAWRAKARCNVVPAERTLELFHELNFHPSDKQISEMLQTAKMLACKNSRQANGLTFGEFCVLAADLKRFRTSAFSSSICDKVNVVNSTENESGVNSMLACHHTTMGKELRSTKSFSSVDDCTKKKKTSITDPTPPVEVFLGGSCNPTTWRADVAIPALNELGISFYNPQVSEWTPDLIELEHRAKEKARVLFFVMDSETRASAGAIEVAHIAGQNCKQLVLVLHPYKPNQTILNERISQQEYVDLIRNQMILRELVTRRGLPVMENIPSGLQRTKDLLAGIRPPPSNIASILVVVRGAFDRVNPINDVISVQKCQRALLYLGYAQSLLGIENLKKIIAKQRASQNALLKQQHKEEEAEKNCSKSQENEAQKQNNEEQIDFDLFCTISAYLSVLQQEIQESGCISPIKGTNVPPPPVYLTNMQGNESFSMSYFGKNISRTSSNTSVPEERQLANKDILSRSRDSGTSSPQPHEQQQQAARRGVQKQKSQQQIMVNYESIETTTTEILTTKTLTTKQITNPTSSNTAAITTLATTSNHNNNNINNNNAVHEEESDSNDSVFSSNSSINSVTCSGSADDLLNCTTITTIASGNNIDFRDVYLGGSCMLRTKWRQDCAIPYLKSKGVNFHLPALHESLQPEQIVDFTTPAETVGTQARSYTRTRRKCKGAELSLTKEESRISWKLPQNRSTLYNPYLLDSSRVLLFVITNETRSLAPMTLAAHCIGLMYNVVLCVQMLSDDCHIGKEKLTPLAIKDYNRARSYLIDLAKRQGVPVFNDLKAALECTVQKVKACTSRQQCD